MGKLKLEAWKPEPYGDERLDWIGIYWFHCSVRTLCAVVDYKAPYEVTVDEFEKRAHEASSLLRAGFIGLQKILDPATTKAVEAQGRFQRGTL